MDLFTTGYDGSVLTAWWELDGWRDWDVVPAPTPQHMGSGASVTAVWRDGFNHLDLFVSGRSAKWAGGAVWSTFYKHPKVGWTSWFEIHRTADQELSETATVAAQWAPGRGRLDLLTTGVRPGSSPNGGVWATSWRPTGGWQKWMAVQPEWKKVAAPDTSVAVGWRGADRLFAVVNGPDSAVYGTFWEPPV